MSGCQPPAQRQRTAIPKPRPPNITNIQAARSRPPLYSSRHPPPPVGADTCWTSWAVSAVLTLGSPLLAWLLGRLDEEPDQRVQLWLLDRLAEILRHDAARIAGLHVRVRV